ncbi:hypothetical protein OROGR_010368 [Orobanche gracilis]
MALRSRSRELSFDILATEYDDVMPTASVSRSNSDPLALQDNTTTSPRKKKKKKKKSSRGKPLQDSSVISENGAPEVFATEGDVNYSCTESSIIGTAVVPDVEGESNRKVLTVTLVSPFRELRQRNVANVMNGGSAEMASEEKETSKKDSNVNEKIAEHWSSIKEINSEQRMELKGMKLEKEGTLDWEKMMAEDPSCSGTLPLEKSPMKYFMEEMYAGNSLRSTTTLGNEKERERVYDTIFRLPWRCELFKRPSSAELSDFGCFVVLVSGVTVLQQADISLIYHMIRGQGIIKLYVVYNVLEIFDKLCQSFGGDVMQALFNSADGLANCSPENMQFWLWRFISDEALAIASSNILCIMIYLNYVAHNNALFAMLVSNNFAEIKSNVFKRYSKDNVQSLVYFDSVERFHISAFVLFVLAQNILEAEGPWLESFIYNALVVYICEVMIDIVKHSFIAKFNDIKPIAFSEFLEDLCKQKLNMQTDNGKKSLLTFVPLAPACVVIRVLRPVYAAHLPYNQLPWRFFWISMTFVMLASLKVMISMGLRKHARWYVKRCERRKVHVD